ncbi:Zinc dependent phospholipase C [Maridesulfovibrio ferrireducens]|uniref:Zinc dependent phospholipase C n=1 Tax=Maridesulfovibrio ferrireducens TaxID=246191 RepID=A0A1G9C2A0_9BACT|nr:zinc dependent phospholipase C family protein [Maridesulfovibrio ferrireducens]SDK45405.1 Zinc dependent phospholipase C [Maridesulfovibrio ferrireducens]
MKKTVLILFITSLAILGFAATSFAWGPGIHMAIGNAVIARPELLPASIARLLLANAPIFLYGCLSADIFIGKGSKAKKKHSHNWQTGFALFDAAKDPHLKAYALGYLSHLAADIVAHNYYVPNLMKQAPSSGKLSHVYIEMLADDQANWSVQQAARLFKHSNQDADLNLREYMDSKKLSFFLKKRVFRQTIGLLEYKSINASLNFSKKVIPAYQAEYLQSILDYSYRLVVNMLNDPHNATALKFDPIGSDHLALAKADNNWRHSLKRTLPFIPRFEVDEIITELPKCEGTECLLKTSHLKHLRLHG